MIAEICLSMRILTLISTATLFAFAASPESTKNPFPEPIVATEGVISVHFKEFAAIPYEGGEAPRLMLLVDEPGTRRLFVNTMRGAYRIHQLRRENRYALSRCERTGLGD